MSGNDTLKGGGGVDTMYGGTGIDTVTYADSPTGVLVLMEIDHYSGGHAYEDTLHDVENLTGSNYDDHLWGTDADVNVLKGGRGNDTLKGFGGADTLEGGSGNDEIWGGLGGDTMTGGLGADKYVYQTPADSGYLGGVADHIIDFQENSGDRIDLSGIDANTLIGTNQSFLFIGNNNPFYVDTDPRGQLRFEGGQLYGDVDGDLNADFRIQIDVAELHDYAFIL